MVFPSLISLDIDPYLFLGLGVQHHRIVIAGIQKQKVSSQLKRSHGNLFSV